MKKIGSLLLTIVLIVVGVGGGLYLAGYSPEDIRNLVKEKPMGPGPVVSTKLPATIAGRLTGLPSFEGAASLRIASLRVVQPETGEVAEAILLAESLDYRVQVPAGLYILIATVADAQSGKQYLGFSRALRVEDDETRQLDISMESSLVTGQPGFSTELGLVKYLRIPRVFATALSNNIALAAPYTVSGEVPDHQSLPAGRTPIVTIRQPFKITEGCQFDYTYSASDVVFTELFLATRDKNIFVDTGPDFQKAVQGALEAQRQGKINPKTWIDYRPLSPYYEVRGEVCAERIYTDPETGLATVEGAWSMKLELVHIETDEVLATRKDKGERVNTRDFFALTVTKFVPEFMGAIMEKEAAAVTRKDTKATRPGGLAGEWVSGVAGKGYVEQCYPGAGPYTMYYDVSLKLSQSGNTVTGTLQLTGRNLVCNFPGTTWEKKLPERKAAFMKERSTHSVSGTVSGSTLIMQVEGHTYNLTHTADKLHGSGRWEGTAATYEGVFDLKRK